MRHRRGGDRAFETRSSSEAIDAVLHKYRIAGEIRERSVLAHWADLVGAKVAARTRPEGITDRVLWVEVATSAWLHELNLLKPQLLMGLISRLGDPRMFDDVRFKLAGRSRREQTVAPRPRDKPPAPTPAVPPATGAARERIVAEASAVDDAELRELIARVRITNDR